MGRAAVLALTAGCAPLDRGATRLGSVAKLPAYRGPLLQVRRDADRIVPYALGCTLFRAANEPKQFVTVPGGNHNDHYTPEYVAALDHFIGSLPQR